MENYRNLTARQLAMIAACTALVAGLTLQRNTVLGVLVFAVAVAFGIAAYRKARRSPLDATPK
ncbi:hypothetical protein [Cognatilysobacter lacus]|uniref:Uncharacterized protein n=1 Tax=Cognatilysobacter lacus TaxID=1643323 RepID=A0A5D8Z7E6_9GAMM|nr:hypothetical protein [Lysobacter lacus]TZF90711.1 hypothetical protein FW784_04210 [Lysobacter lacus]